jgi:hypothetical protein
MIRGEKQKFPIWILHRYLGWRLRRMFHAIYLSGAVSALEDSSHFPVVLFSNHQSWWDAFLMQPLFDFYGISYYVMMEERNLKRFPFFRRVGVFGVDLESRQGRASSLLYAGRLLKQAPEGEKRLLLVYPHGRLVDPVEPWPEFQPGITHLVGLNPAGISLPLYIHLRMGRYPLPEAFLRLGRPVPKASLTSPAALSDHLVEARDALMVDLIQGDIYSRSIPLQKPPRHFRGKTE